MGYRIGLVEVIRSTNENRNSSQENLEVINLVFLN
jgi:hypothetical protein